MKKLKTYLEIYMYDMFFVGCGILGAFFALLAVTIEFRFIYLAIILQIPNLFFCLYKPLSYTPRTTFYKLDSKTDTQKIQKGKMKKSTSFRMIFISDLHFHDFMPKNYYKHTFEKINKLRPDVILFGGDFVHDRDTRFEQLEDLRILEAKYKLAVLGNHDYDVLKTIFKQDSVDHKNIEYAETVSKELQRNGITVLRNDNYTLNLSEQTLNIFGVDSLWAKRNDISKYKPSEFNIVLAHNPRIFEELNLENVSLVLCGHNHGGGQIRLNKYISVHRIMGLIQPLWRKGFGRWVSGLYSNKYGLRMLLTRGLGLTGISVRINCPPEICVIDIN